MMINTIPITVLITTMVSHLTINSTVPIKTEMILVMTVIR